MLLVFMLSKNKDCKLGTDSEFLKLLLLRDDSYLFKDQQIWFNKYNGLCIAYLVNSYADRAAK